MHCTVLAHSHIDHRYTRAGAAGPLLAAARVYAVQFRGRAGGRAGERACACERCTRVACLRIRLKIEYQMHFHRFDLDSIVSALLVIRYGGPFTAPTHTAQVSAPGRPLWRHRVRCAVRILLGACCLLGLASEIVICKSLIFCAYTLSTRNYEFRNAEFSFIESRKCVFLMQFSRLGPPQNASSASDE